MRFYSFVAAAALLSASLAAHASPITYTVTDTATGQLGSTAFTNALITISFISDTNSVLARSSTLYVSSAGSETVQIGVGPVVTVDSAPFFADNQTLAGGFAAVGSGALDFGTESTAFATYNGMSAIGPIIGPVFFQSGSVDTSSGAFTLNSAGPLSTFTATMPTSVTPEPMAVTPEPSSVALLGTGMLGVLGVARKRFA